jgi:glycosyltransferase involved in cell wall biosynthesis
VFRPVYDDNPFGERFLMKIGFLGSAAKIHFYRWSRWLAEHGHEVVLFSDVAPPPEWEYGNVRLRQPEWNLWRNLLVFKLKGGPYANNREKWRAYRRVIDEERPDILHAHEALAYGPTLAHFPEYRRVLTPWGPDIELLDRSDGDPEARDLVRTACASADLITTNAPGLEDHWARLTAQPSDKFRLFSWGVDLTIFHPQSREKQRALRERLRLPLDQPLIVSPRLAKPYYNIDTIMKAWAGATAAGQVMVILRAGADDESWTALLALHRELRTPSLHMVDELLNQQEMATLYSTCDAMVMVPKTDLVAASLVEGMACGCFPIVADLPCYRTLLAHQETRDGMGTGWFAPALTPEGLREGLNWWASLPNEERTRLHQHNSDYSGKHQDWNHCAAKMVEVYQEVLAAKR